MFLCFRCKIEERRPEWRGGVISWQRLISAVTLGGKNVLLSSPPFAKAARDTERQEVRREKGGGVQSWHTLLSSPRLLAGKLSDTTDYSSHYSQRLTSASVWVRVCMNGLISTANCVSMHACLLLFDLQCMCMFEKLLALDHQMHSRKYLRMLFDQVTFDLTYVGLAF